MFSLFNIGYFIGAIQPDMFEDDTESQEEQEKLIQAATEW